MFLHQKKNSTNPSPNPNPNSSGHTGGPGDSGDVQLPPLPVSFHESVGGETPVGKIHLDGHTLTRFTVGVNKIAGATVSVPV